MSIKLTNAESCFVWKSDAIHRIMQQISSIAKTDANVLICGESGTGKELIAKTIYSNSLRECHNFVPINCASLPENLLESELFGHEKGAFSGAVSRKRGLFEYAHQGTAFLDEVSEMSQYMQAKLLRFLEDGSFRRIGSTQLKFADVRILAATNLPPQQAISKRKLRLDLFHRLSTTSIHIPPLRERPEDIKEILLYYMNKVGDRHGKRISGIDSDAIRILARYEWPGNVRELRNVAHQLVYFSKSENITIEDLKSVNLPTYPSRYADDKINEYKLEKERVLHDFHKKYFGCLIKTHQGNLSKVAEVAGISRTALYQIIGRVDPHSDLRRLDRHEPASISKLRR